MYVNLNTVTVVQRALPNRSGNDLVDFLRALDVVKSSPDLRHARLDPHHGFEALQGIPPRFRAAYAAYIAGLDGKGRR